MNHLLRNTALAALMALSASAQAAIQSYTFSGQLESGYYFGQTFSGTFSFDDAGLTGSGTEYLDSLIALSLSLNGDTVGLNDADVPAEVGFGNGEFLGLSASFSGIDPQFTLIPGSLDSSDAWVAYDTTQGLSGTGNVLYTVSAPVPEADAYAYMLLGMGLLGLLARRRKG